MHDIIPVTAINIIYTGVAGTGKTYQLLQLAKQYTDYLPFTDTDVLLTHLLEPIGWREVVCLVLLDLKVEQQDLAKVPEIVAHKFFIAKAAQNARVKNLNSTAWSVLQMHSPIDSKTVSCDNRASQAYFDKDASGAWYLLSDSLPLLTSLEEQLAEYYQALQHTQSKQALSRQRFIMVSFHQAYGYEEFVEGIRPVLNERPSHPSQQNSQMHYVIQEGAFLQLCQRAASDPTRRYAMLIDEINRANVTRVFGELLSLIEPDKRHGQAHAMQVNLAYSGRAFSVPTNVDIYATMNTQDHSLAPLDMALRRRFRFIDCSPKPELLGVINVVEDCAEILTHSQLEDRQIDKLSTNNQVTITIDLAKILSGLNQRILHSLGQEAQLGHAFLFSVETLAQLQTALIEQIIPQLIQATGGQLALLQYLFNDEQQSYDLQFIQNGQEQVSNPSSFESKSMDYHQGFGAHWGQSMTASSYRINPELIARAGAFTKEAVYQRLY